MACAHDQADGELAERFDAYRQHVRRLPFSADEELDLAREQLVPERIGLPSRRGRSPGCAEPLEDRCGQEDRRHEPRDPEADAAFRAARGPQPPMGLSRFER